MSSVSVAQNRRKPNKTMHKEALLRSVSGCVNVLGRKHDLSTGFVDYIASSFAALQLDHPDLALELKLA